MKDIIVNEVNLAGKKEDYKGFCFELPTKDNDYFHMQEQLLAYIMGLLE